MTKLPIGAALNAPPPPTLAHMPPAMPDMMHRPGVTPQTFRDIRLRTVRRMHQAGVQLVAGRDSGIAPNLAHGSLPASVAFLVEAGATIAEALTSATTKAAAQGCGLSHTKASLHLGWRRHTR